MAVWLFLLLFITKILIWSHTYMFTMNQLQLLDK